MVPIKELVRDLLAKHGVEVAFREDHNSSWSQAALMLDYHPVFYQSHMLDYQYAYQRGLGGKWLDISMILIQNGKPAGIWPLSASTRDTKLHLSSYGLAVIPPLFVKNIQPSVRKKLVKNCMRFMKEFCAKNGIEKWESAESFSGSASARLSEWHEVGMQMGASTRLTHELYVDVSQGIQSFRRGLRKSYKPLISAGERLWKVEVLAGDNPNIWEEFRQLHVMVSGRETRSRESWDAQYECITTNHAMLVYLRNDDERMIGGGFFQYTQNEALYSVGAYDRALFDQPLGHVVQSRAIDEMIARGLVWYKLGERPYAADEPPPSDKEISIAHFKQGFATHIMPKYWLTHTTRVG